MSYRRMLAVLILLGSGGGVACGQEATAKSKIVSVGLFKNGLAVIKREVSVPGGGTFRIDHAPEPVHGTFWIDSEARVEAAVKLRDVPTAAHESGSIDLQEDLAGKTVTITLQNEKLAPIVGKVLPLGAGRAAAADTAGAGFGMAYPYYAPASAPEQRFLVVQTAKGRRYLDRSAILTVDVEGNDEKATKRKPVLVFTADKAAKLASFQVNYLTHGLAWAPSYRLDVSAAKTLTIEMSAVVRNEAEDFDEADVWLITGYPSVEFANVTSLLAPQASWAGFFQQIQNPGGTSQPAILGQFGGGFGGNVAAPAARPAQPPPAGERLDLHYESIGKRSLRKGESFSMTVQRAKADYERVAEWHVGKPANEQETKEGPHREEVWDTLRFKNPFKFPLTTAPALVAEGPWFNGQRTLYWTASDEETSVRITKALDLQPQFAEEYDKTKPAEDLVVRGNNYRKVYLTGELRVRNPRKIPLTMAIHHRITGVLDQAEGAPRVVTVVEPYTQVNRTRDLRWTITVPPGEEKRLTYHYSKIDHESR